MWFKIFGSTLPSRMAGVVFLCMATVKDKSLIDITCNTFCIIIVNLDLFFVIYFSRIQNLINDYDMLLINPVWTQVPVQFRQKRTKNGDRLNIQTKRYLKQMGNCKLLDERYYFVSWKKESCFHEKSGKGFFKIKAT